MCLWKPSLEEIRRRGGRAVRLSVAEFNGPAIAVYERHRFTAVEKTTERC
jgi:ribosomal protein S18 acetylase RimI-like enzyme